MNQNNEYFVNLNIDEILSKNVIVAKNINNQLAIIIKNSNADNICRVFSTDNLQLKTCSRIYQNDEYVGTYHIILCLSEEPNIIEDFKKVFNIMILKNPKAMSSFDVLALFNSIDVIFRTTIENENKDLQIGLFGELLTLKYIYDRGGTDIINRWHTNFYSKHDIELDRQNRIEIKTTTKEERSHNFKHNQLTRKDVKVYVVSCLLEIVEEGLSLGELIDQIIDLCYDLKKISLLHALKKKCGINDSNKGLIFNEELAYMKIKLFDSAKIPQICEEIPEAITNITYEVNLSNTEHIDFCVLINLLQ